MISVKNLSKYFGSTLAVDGVTFEIPKGQVVGFLGPNGAGKTTTMRLLTGFLAPDDGVARVAGFDLMEKPIDARRALGYLPENNPLPDDMEVTDFLHYMARLRGLNEKEQRTDCVRKAIQLCSLAGVVGKKISELSKGYRQRVGLAQAIVHDPDILILDEPTSGLDPNQVQDMRALIHDLGREKTVILSTHILSEVQHTCDRVFIINKGKLVADGRPDELSGSAQAARRLFIALKGPSEEIQSALSSLPGVASVRSEKEGDESGFLLESQTTDDIREAIFHLAVQRQWPILSMTAHKVSLEDVFRTLTQQPSSERPHA